MRRITTGLRDSGNNASNDRKRQTVTDRTFAPPTPGPRVREYNRRLAALPPMAARYPLHPTMRLDVEGVEISVRFDRWDADQATYEWEVSAQGVSDTGPMRGQGGEPIALDSALRQILDALRDQPGHFPNMTAAGLDCEYIAGAANHYLPSTEQSERTQADPNFYGRTQ